MEGPVLYWRTSFTRGINRSPHSGHSILTLPAGNSRPLLFVLLVKCNRLADRGPLSRFVAMLSKLRRAGADSVLRSQCDNLYHIHSCIQLA